MLRPSLAGRAHCALCFALLLLAITAVPVFAAETPGGGEEAPSLSEIPAPSAEELAGAETEQRERAEWLSSPEAREEREASLTAYASLSADEAKSLLVEAFPEQLAQLNADPARVLSELEVEKPLGTYGALVADEAGETAILNSSAPVESELGGEGEQPVDLALEETGSGYVPQNPISEVALPGSAEGPIQLEGGVEVELPASDDHAAEPLGEMNLFMPETETTTDTLLAPRAGGVEVFEQLRSPESPERFSFNLSLPEGATLRPSEAGGAEIISSSGEKIEEVPPASATDAQGAAVPVTTSVEGDSLVLEVQHRSQEMAYPLLLDPEFVNDTTSFGEWVPSLNSPYEYILNNNGSSLDAISKGHYKYPAGTHGQWAYGAYGQTSYIAAATFSPIDFYVHTASCQTYDPHGYIGLYNPASDSYVARGIWAWGTSENASYPTGWLGNTGTKDAIIGIGADHEIEIGCAHELYVGGYSIQEKDPEAPSITSVGGVSSGWVKELTVTPHVSDPGLGVKAITLSPEGSSPHTNAQGCSGANGSRCPASWETSFGGSYFAEGERSAAISAYDPLGPDVASHVSASYQFTTRVDRQKPEVELEGEFTEALKEAEKEGEGNKAPALHLPVYNLKIKATDKANEGDPKTEAKARRSGVKNIKFFLEGKELKVPWGPQECPGPEYSCPMSETFPVPLNEVQGTGVHKLKVIATDQAGNEREREIEFEYFPATGIKDEYVMQHFPLPDGEGNEAEEEEPKRPELAVNVTDGNLVFRQRDVEVTGPGTALEVERFYNSELPRSQATEWGTGWTLGQTPKLEPEEAGEAPKKAALVGTSGTLTGAVSLPTESGGEKFEPKLQAVVTKEAGGYAIADQSGETDATQVFNQAGKMTELQTPGSAVVKYSYTSGILSQIAVNDPGTAGSSIRTGAEAEAEAHLATPSYRSSFSAAGSGNGQLKHPADVAVDAKGNLWVADKENNRVEEFNEAGEYLRAAGSLGSGAGQLNSPSGVAMDSFGDVDVTDTANNRVVRFNEKGEFVSAVGANVNRTKVESGGTLAEKNHCTASSGNVCQAGTSGSAEGLMAEPIGITTTGGGNFLVVEKANGRVEKFNTSGELLAKFGTSTTEGHQLKEPTAITNAPNGGGYFWVADTGNNRIEEWTSSFAFVRAVGVEGTGNGQFKHPDAIEADAEGNVYVADKGNGRVQELNSSGEYLAKFGSSGSGATQFSLADPAGVTVDNKGNIWLTDPGNDRVERWLAPYNPVYASQLGSTGSGNGQFKHPADVAIDAKGDLWVLDKENNRIEEFNAAGEFVRSAGSLGSGAGQLNSPSGVAIDSFGDVDVTDTANNRVVRFNEKGEFVSSVGANVNKTKVESGGTLAEKNHCTASSGNVCQAGTAGSAEGLMAAPIGITTSGGGNFFVVEKANNRVEKFNTNGELLAHFGSLGSGEGQLKEPTAIATAPNGYLWVADTGNNRIEQWTSSYAYKRTAGKEGTGNGEFKHPDAIEADAEGNVYVVDQGNGRVQEFSETGKYLSRFASSGTGTGQLSLSDPAGVAVEANGNIWVTDPGNNRIERWVARSTAPSSATAPVEADPAVAVKTASGLVTGVEGEKAGATTYAHQG